MSVVETAACERSFAVDDVHDAARLWTRLGFLDHLLENPGMVGAAFDFQAYNGIYRKIHLRMITEPVHQKTGVRGNRPWNSAVGDDDDRVVAYVAHFLCGTCSAAAGLCLRHHRFSR